MTMNNDQIEKAYDEYWADVFDTFEEDMEDVVNNPSHYTSGKYETINIIEDATSDLEGIKAFACGNALKYIIRHNKKGKPKEDIEKAIFYLNKLIEAHNG